MEEDDRPYGGDQKSTESTDETETETMRETTGAHAPRTEEEVGWERQFGALRLELINFVDACHLSHEGFKESDFGKVQNGRMGERASALKITELLESLRDRSCPLDRVCERVRRSPLTCSHGHKIQFETMCHAIRVYHGRIPLLYA